jgi:hypothetical protein
MATEPVFTGLEVEPWQADAPPIVRSRKWIRGDLYHRTGRIACII